MNNMMAVADARITPDEQAAHDAGQWQERDDGIVEEGCDYEIEMIDGGRIYCTAEVYGDGGSDFYPVDADLNTDDQEPLDWDQIRRWRTV